MTITAQSIVRRATDLIFDQTSIKWPVSEMVRWLNDAQRAIVKVRPDVMNTTANFRCVQGSRQSLKSATANEGAAPLSPAPSKLIDATRNMATGSAKMAVSLVQRQLLDAQVRGWHNITPSIDVIHFMVDPRDPTTFYTYPPATSAAELEVMYSAYPTDITEPGDGATYTSVSGNISLPDIYAEDILHYICAKAYMKDSTFAGALERAAFYLKLLQDSLGADIAATVAVQPKINPALAKASI